MQFNNPTARDANVLLIVDTAVVGSTGQFRLSSTVATVDGGGTAPQPFATNTMPYGSSFSDWMAAWSRWILAQPLATNPGYDSDGRNCAVGQSGPVWFLSGTFDASAVTRTCTIPADKALFFPLAAYLSDYPCPDPSFHPPDGGSLEDFLTADARGYVDQISVFSFTYNGSVRFPNPASYRAHSRLFNFTADRSLTGDPCFTYSEQPAVIDGLWIMLPPLPSRLHQIEWATSGQSVTYILDLR